MDAPKSPDQSMTLASSATNAPEAFGSTLPPGLERDNLERARRYLAAIEADSPGADVASLAYLAPDVRQVEYPNRFTPNGAERDRRALAEAAERGRRVLRSQRYDVRTALASGDEVALEVLWVGTLAVPIGTLAAGAEMRAHFGVFLTFRDGLIVRQRNYDCFDPF
jgi:ketosteroid isomerase-like protein